MKNFEKTMINTLLTNSVRLCRATMFSFQQKSFEAQPIHVLEYWMSQMKHCNLVFSRVDLYSYAWLEFSRKKVQFSNHDMESCTKQASLRRDHFVKLTCNVPFTRCKHTGINYANNSLSGIQMPHRIILKSIK